MRKLLTLKTLLRAPIKTILTFLLLVAASFALFSKVTDFAITMREIAHAESFCKGVAALDNTTPEIFVQGSGSGLVSDYTVYEVEGKPWPTEEQIEGFTSLPGVTLADTRYMTAGLVEGYKRLREEGYNTGKFVIEGTYVGCEYTPNTTGVMELTFEDIRVLASDDKLNLERPIEAIGVDDQTFYDNPYPVQYFEKLEKGSRCLITGEYSDLNNNRLHMGMGADAFRVLDGLGENYLEMEAFAYQKGLIEVIKQNRYTYDIVYTSDMRSIPRFNEHSMVISEGRPLVAADTDVCVVNQLFLDTYGLSIGDKIHVELGDSISCEYYCGLNCTYNLLDSVHLDMYVPTTVKTTKAKTTKQTTSKKSRKTETKAKTNTSKTIKETSTKFSGSGNTSADKKTSAPATKFSGSANEIADDVVTEEILQSEESNNENVEKRESFSGISAQNSSTELSYQAKLLIIIFTVVFVVGVICIIIGTVNSKKDKKEPDCNE